MVSCARGYKSPRRLARALTTTALTAELGFLQVWGGGGRGGREKNHEVRDSLVKHRGKERKRDSCNTSGSLVSQESMGLKESRTVSLGPATHCATRSATQCNALQHTATRVECGRVANGTTGSCNTHYNTLKHTATHCNTMQHTATHRTTLQHTVVRVVGGCCMVLQVAVCHYFFFVVAVFLQCIAENNDR